jgi:hypothetical protein
MVMEHLPGTPLLTRDSLDSMKTDSVAPGPIDPERGIVPDRARCPGTVLSDGKETAWWRRCVHVRAEH